MDVLVDMELILVVLIPTPVVNIVKAAAIRSLQGQKKLLLQRDKAWKVLDEYIKHCGMIFMSKEKRVTKQQIDDCQNTLTEANQLI